jgi:hypothetical protein
MSSILAAAIETATWGLVGVTALLVAVTAILAAQSGFERRSRRRTLAASLVPDMHLLRTRLNGRIGDLDAARDIENAGLMRETAEDTQEFLDMVDPLIAAAPSEGLLVTNELYVLRHLITQALNAAAGADDPPSPKTSLRVYRLLVAAKITLDSAEAGLPKRFTMIGGERFWDRLTRVSEERLAAAELTRQRDLGR